MRHECSFCLALSTRAYLAVPQENLVQEGVRGRALALLAQVGTISQGSPDRPAARSNTRRHALPRTRDPCSDWHHQSWLTWPSRRKIWYREACATAHSRSLPR